MDQIVTRTKVILPGRRPGFLSRPRLLEFLEELLDYKVILVIAPAGYGKTTLLLDFAHHIKREIPACWLTIDALDQDLQRFLAHFVASLTQRFPQFGRHSLASLRNLAAGQSVLDQFLTVIVNDLYENVREHFLLVLDDYHLIDEKPQIAYFVSQFVQRVAENCHLALASRTLLNLPDLPLMVARANVGGLSLEELAFQASELQSLLRLHRQLDVGLDEAKELVDATEGWITGILLSTELGAPNTPGRPGSPKASGVHLYDYMAEQILDRQPESIRTFLLRTSLLGEFDAMLCQTVLGPAMLPPGLAWQDLINTVLRSNLFVLPVGERGQWLRYHHLFQAFLQKRLAQERPEEEVLILQRLANAYIQQEEWEQAYQILSRHQDMDALANLVEQTGSPLLKSGRVLLLASWLEALPPGVLSSRPGLISLHGSVAIHQGKVDQGLAQLNRADTLLRAADDWRLLARNLVRRAIAYRFQGDYQAALADARKAVTTLESAPCQDQEVLSVQAEALRLEGLSLYMMGTLDEGIERLKAARAGYESLEDPHSAALVTLDIATAYLGAGSHSHALSEFEDALKSWRSLHNLMWQSNILNNLGVLRHQQGAYEAALELFNQALEDAIQSGYSRMIAFIFASIGDLFAEVDADGIAQESYRNAYEIAQRVDERHLLFYLDLARAALARCQGFWVLAQDFLDSARKYVSPETSIVEWGLYRMAEGRHHLDNANWKDALSALQQAIDSFSVTGQRTEEATAHLLSATGYALADDRENTLYHVARAFQIAAKLENWHPLVATRPVTRQALLIAQEQDSCREQADRLLRQVKSFEETLPDLRRRLRQRMPAQLTNLPSAQPVLSIRSLGRGEVFLGGKYISAGDWQTQTARNLFFCFLAHPDGLTKEEVGAIFWPECSPTQLKMRFKNAIYRLRSALSLDVILFEDNLYLFNRRLDYEYDMETFLDQVTQARNATDPPIKIAAYREAIRLYRGSFLPDIEEVWAQLERERLLRIFVQAVLDLGKLLFGAGDLDEALECCRRVLVEDPCLEDAHRLAMRLHAAAGNRSAVARQFEQCQQALQAELDVPPSPKTEILFNELMR